MTEAADAELEALRREVMELRRAATERDRFFSLSLDFLCVASAEGYFRRLSPSFALLGYSNEELCSRPFIEFVHPDDVTATLRCVAKMTAGEQVIRFENRYRNKDGSYRSLSWSACMADGLIYASAHDQTARKESDAKLETYNYRVSESNRELQDFAMVASHDLQEPLRKIQMFGDRLQEECGATLGETGADYLRRMQSAAARGQSLIQGLLAFSRVAAKELPSVAVDLNLLGQDVASDVESALAESGGTLTRGPLPTVDGDPVQLRQLLQNLITNGLKFRREGVPPLIELSAERISSPAGTGNGFWRIAVADNGIGFDEKYLPRIFTLFQRLNERGKFSGSGIGLAICRKIAVRHGGAITASSVPGRGSTFFVDLPARPGE